VQVGQDGTALALLRQNDVNLLPALLISPKLSKNFHVDETSHDTTSILAAIEHRFGVPARSSRDAKVADFSGVLRRSGHGHDD
jgi:hypothetical protein